MTYENDDWYNVYDDSRNFLGGGRLINSSEGDSDDKVEGGWSCRWIISGKCICKDLRGGVFLLMQIGKMMKSVGGGDDVLRHC